MIHATQQLVGDHLCGIKCTGRLQIIHNLASSVSEVKYIAIRKLEICVPSAFSHLQVNFVSSLASSCSLVSLVTLTVTHPFTHFLSIVYSKVSMREMHRQNGIFTLKCSMVSILIQVENFCYPNLPGLSITNMEIEVFHELRQ